MLLQIAATCEDQVSLLSNVTHKYFAYQLAGVKGVLLIKICGCSTL